MPIHNGFQIQPAPNRRDALQCVSTTEPSEKFQNKYRIPSARLKNYDYGEDGAYFVTICTKNREPFFGEIKNGKMQLSKIGKIIEEEWQKTVEIRKNITLGEWVVMPNHVHGIIFINGNSDGEGCRDAIHRVSVKNTDAIHRNTDAINGVSTNGGITKNNNPMLHENLSTIIRWYKGRTTFEIRKFNPDFSWQPRFHDHIIRNETELTKISEYIFHNPQNWVQDDYF